MHYQSPKGCNNISCVRLSVFFLLKQQLVYFFFQFWQLFNNNRPNYVYRNGIIPVNNSVSCIDNPAGVYNVYIRVYP